jgi:hypothetical protein
MNTYSYHGENLVLMELPFNGRPQSINIITGIAAIDDMVKCAGVFNV